MFLKSSKLGHEFWHYIKKTMPKNFNCINNKKIERKIKTKKMYLTIYLI